MIRIRLINPCNNNCIICKYRTDADPVGQQILNAFYSIDKPVESSMVLQLLKETMNKDFVVFEGTEPTLHPDILKFIRCAKNYHYAGIKIVTNGRQLYYRSFCESLKINGVTEIETTLHGSDEATHDNITRAKGSFAQTTTGIKNALRAGFGEVVCNIPINRINFREVPDTIRMLKGLCVQKVKLLNLFPFGNAYINLGELALSVAEARECIEAAIAVAQEDNVTISLKNFPRVDFYMYDQYLIPSNNEILNERTRHIINNPPQCRGERCACCHFDFFCTCAERIRDEIARGTPVCGHVFIPGVCSRRCVFCTAQTGQLQEEVPDYSSVMERVEKDLKGAESLGAEVINISGHEPLDFPKISDVLKLAKAAGGKRFIISTTGLRLADEQFFNRLVEELGEFEVWMPLYGDTEELHDSIVKSSGDFKRALQAMRNVSSSGKATLKINTIILKENYSRLPQTAQVALAAGASKFIYTFVEPQSMPVETYLEIAPRMSDVIPFLEERFITNELGIPPCLLWKHGKLTDHYRFTPVPLLIDGVMFAGEVIDMMAYVNCQFREDCSLRGRCGGLSPKYIEAFGVDEFTPIR
ncbi:MAG: radical SAM protein [bacterium]